MCANRISVEGVARTGAKRMGWGDGSEEPYYEGFCAEKHNEVLGEL
jgi:hypothetical protein